MIQHLDIKNGMLKKILDGVNSSVEKIKIKLLEGKPHVK